MIIDVFMERVGSCLKCGRALSYPEMNIIQQLGNPGHEDGGVLCTGVVSITDSIEFRDPSRKIWAAGAS